MVMGIGSLRLPSNIGEGIVGRKKIAPKFDYRKYQEALTEIRKKGGTLTKEVRDNVRAYIESNPTTPGYLAGQRVRQGWTADPEKKKEIDRIKKIAKESEAAQAQQRSAQIQKERDAREEEDRLKTEAIRTAATRPTPVAPVMPTPQPIAPTLPIEPEPIAPVMPTLPVEPEPEPAPIVRDLIKETAPTAPKTVEEIIAQITETEPGMDPVQEAVNKAVGIAPTPQPVLPTPQPTPDLPPVTPPTVAPVMPTMTEAEPGMDTTVGPPGTTIDPIQEAVNKATGVSLPMPAAQVVPESISKVAPQPTFPVETEPGMTTPNTGIMAPVTQPVQATTMPRPVEPEIREVVKPPAPPPLPTMLPTETEPTTGVDYNTGIMQPVQTAPVTPPVTTAPPVADLTQNIAEPAVPVDPVQEAVDVAVGGKGPTPAQQAQLEIDKEAWKTDPKRFVATPYWIAPNWWENRSVPSKTQPDPVQDAVDAAVGDSDMEGYISYSGKDEGGWYTVGPKGKTYLPKFPTADPVQEAVDAAVGGGTPPVVEEEVVTEETPVDQGPSEIDKLRELIAQLQAQQAEQQTAQQAAAQQRAAQEAEMAQNYMLTGPSIGYNPYVSGQYQSDPYGAAGVPDLGGITTIPVPAPWQPPTLQPWGQ
jgi:hypothetical protein